MASQEGSQTPLTDYYTFIKLWLRVDLYLSNIYIALPLGHHLEGVQIDTGKKLCNNI